MEIIPDNILSERKIDNTHHNNMMNEGQTICFMSEYIDQCVSGKIHDNEDVVGKQICDKFRENLDISMILVVALTQSGKTGSMYCTMKHCIQCDVVPVQNIYVITGLSSKDWKADTIARFPKIIRDNVYHLPDISRSFIKNINEQRNVLIIMDEIQIASKTNQQIYKTFMTSGLFNKQNMYEKDIKIVEFSATPDGVLYDAMKWDSGFSLIVAQPGEGYTSAFDLYNSGRVKEYKDLGDERYGVENIEEIKVDITNHFADSKKYHIIRTHKGNSQIDLITNFKKIFGDQYAYIAYGQENKTDINIMLRDEPQCHTFVFIKEMFRCSKVLEKKHIGICYERMSKNPDYSVIMQSVLGRCTGYGDTGNTIIYTCCDAIIAYKKLWDSGFTDMSVDWKSKTTKIEKGVLVSNCNSFNIIPIDESQRKKNTSIKDKTIMCKKFKNVTGTDPLKSANAFFKEYVKKEGSRSMGPRERGTTIQKQIGDKTCTFYQSCSGKNKKIRTVSEIKQISRLGLGNNGKTHTQTTHAAYEDVNDPDTLWWIMSFIIEDGFVDPSPEITV